MTRDELEQLRSLIVRAKHELKKEYSPSLDMAIDLADACIANWDESKCYVINNSGTMNLTL